MKKSKLFRFCFVLFFSLSLGSYLFLQHQSTLDASMDTETETAIEVAPQLLESGASMLLLRAIGTTSNLMSR